MISPWLYILTRQLDIKINVPNRNRVPTNRSHLLQNWDKQTNKKQLKNRNKNKNNSAKSIPQTFQTAVVAAVTFGDNLKKTAIKISIRLNLWRREECHAQVISHPVFTVDDRVALFLRRSQWEMKRQQRYPTAWCWVERWRRISKFQGKTKRKKKKWTKGKKEKASAPIENLKKKKKTHSIHNEIQVKGVLFSWQGRKAAPQFPNRGIK